VGNYCSYGCPKGSLWWIVGRCSARSRRLAPGLAHPAGDGAVRSESRTDRVPWPGRGGSDGPGGSANHSPAGLSRGCKLARAVRANCCRPASWCRQTTRSRRSRPPRVTTIPSLGGQGHRPLCRSGWGLLVTVGSRPVTRSRSHHHVCTVSGECGNWRGGLAIGVVCRLDAAG
jgi:hypothetical protein